MRTRLALPLAVAAAIAAAGCRSTIGSVAPRAVGPATVAAGSFLDHVELCWASVDSASSYTVDFARTQSMDSAGTITTAGSCLPIATLDTASTWYFTVSATIGSGATMTTSAPTRPIAASLPGIENAMGPPTWAWSGPVSGNEYGGAIFPVGDVNGDGWPDFGVAGLAGGTTRMLELLGGPARGPDDLDGRLGCQVSANSVSGTSALAGWSMAGADLDGDGYGEILVGIPQHALTGEVAILSGGPGAGCNLAALEDGTSADEELGRSLAVLGDVDGDGLPDWAVGTPGTLKGDVELHSGLSTAPYIVLDGISSGSRFGTAVAPFGPVAGNAHAAIAIGAPSGDGPPNQEDGTVTLCWGFHEGSCQSLPTGPVEPGAPNDAFGTVLAPAGDVNGDGLADLLVGSGPRDLATAPLGPRAYLLLATSGTPAYGKDDFRQIFQGTHPPSGAGVPLAIAGAGDVDGDGFGDVLVGDPLYANGTGRVVLLRGGPQGIDPAAPPLWVAYGPGTGEHFGAAVAGIGDVDRDGFADIAVGSPPHGTGDEGLVQVWRGHARWGLQVSIATPLRTHRGDSFYPSLQLVDPIGFGPYTLTLDCDDGNGPQTSPLDPSSLPACRLGTTGRHEIRLRIDAADGRFGEALVAVEVVP